MKCHIIIQIQTKPNESAKSTDADEEDSAFFKWW